MGTYRLLCAALTSNCFTADAMWSNLAVGARNSFCFRSIVIPMWSPAKGSRVVPFRWMYAQLEIVEEGDRDLPQLYCRGEGLGEEREVVHEWEQPSSRQSPLPTNPNFLCLAYFPDGDLDSGSYSLSTNTYVSF
jgi:hypothetical protein